jgi:hypothetical protein
MRIREIKESLDNILTIDDPEERKDALKSLREDLDKTWLKKVKRGNYVYLYKIKYIYDPDADRTKEQVIGQEARIPKNIYRKHEKKLEDLRTSNKKKELKKYLKKLKEKGGNDQR